MRVKIATPNNTVTGGIELLHQVCAELNKYIPADIWYMADPFDTRIPDEYLCYGNHIDNRIEPDDVILFPEIWANHIWRYFGHQTIVYWESVDNYFPHTPKDQWYQFLDDTIHISQTEYSNTFLKDVIKAKNVIEITDYVHDDYLNCDRKADREKVVLYNPVKGFELTEKIIQAASDIKFVPVAGMKRAEIIELMRHSMVWIDFGNFPGKDRLPREAGACGMCLITGKRGSAKYKKDMGIPEEYKISDANYADIGNITDKIRDILDNFDERSKLYEPYRKRLKQEKKEFVKGVKKLAERLNEI